MFRFHLLIPLLLSVVLLAACSPQREPQPPSPCPPGGFAIFLTAEKMNGADILKADLSHLKLQDQPAIASDEIISYDIKGRELHLVPDALDRLSKWNVPLDGRAFVACAESQPLFGGAFWNYLSSLIFEGVSLMVPVPGMESAHLESGYPTSRFASGYDPFQDAKVLDILRKEKKLK